MRTRLASDVGEVPTREYSIPGHRDGRDDAAVWIGIPRLHGSCCQVDGRKPGPVLPFPHEAEVSADVQRVAFDRQSLDREVGFWIPLLERPCLPA